MREPVDITEKGEEALRKQIKEERGRRKKFLVRLYEESKADVGRSIAIKEFIGHIDLIENEASKVARYLAQCGLVELIPTSSADAAHRVVDVRITAHGIDAVEQIVMGDGES